MNFREAVYVVVRAIPPGRVMTYSQVALTLGYPRAARAVGGALHVVPDPVDIPWWRVINQQGRISIRGDAGSADLQLRLLLEEGIVLDDKGGISLERYRWWPPEELEQQVRLGPGTIDLFDRVNLR